MDVIRWRVSVRRDSGNYRGQPGVTLTLELKCRVCNNRKTLWAAVELHPANLDPKSRTRVGSPQAKESWNQWLVEHRLANSRHCSECGVASIIPPAQQKALTFITDDVVQLEWLQKVVAEMQLEIRRQLVTNARHESDRVYENYYVAPKGGPFEFSLEWQPFQLVIQQD